MVKIIDDSINNLFGIKEGESDRNVNAIYNKDKANAQVNQLIDVVIRGLCKLNKPFKYCVTSILMQNNGAQMDTARNLGLIQCWPTTTPTPTEW